MAWVAVGVAGAIAVVILVLRALEWHQRRVHRRIVSADYLDVRQLRLPPCDPPPTFVVTDLVDSTPYDQDSD